MVWCRDLDARDPCRAQDPSRSFHKTQSSIPKALRRLTVTRKLKLVAKKKQAARAERAPQSGGRGHCDPSTKGSYISTSWCECPAMY